jgi:hypothetical protein
VLQKGKAPVAENSEAIDLASHVKGVGSGQLGAELHLGLQFFDVRVLGAISVQPVITGQEPANDGRLQFVEVHALGQRSRQGAVVRRTKPAALHRGVPGRADTQGLGGLLGFESDLVTPEV